MTSTSGRATAVAQPNIALVKYWGKRNDALNLPASGSLSITLDALHTRTSIHFDAALACDDIVLNGLRDEAESRKLGAFLDLVREHAGVATRAQVTSDNDFPTGAGLASSASGFAALVVAADRALGLGLDAAELSRLARRGSGSAARSIFGGFVEMAAGTRDDGEDAFATPLLAPHDWPLAVVVAVTTRAAKSVSSRSGMDLSRRTSPFYRDWIAVGAHDLAAARDAVMARDFEQLARVGEASCLAMHAVMLSTRPGLVYWNGATVECMQRVRHLRERGGHGVFFTIDAGPQVKAVCLPGDAPAVAGALRDVAGVEDVLVSGLGDGARVIDTAKATA
ncbi:MAG TPA: diphosphomevalonate decarboxylase [Rhodanobacteraceae bacterium]|jgi:diphosphomevalonate decarboxylase|nr:diphosphomevalonate decarboxylase [Rhodanobacteraceae bacterium]